MTAACARGSQQIRSNSTRGKERLEGLVPVVEDWHAKLCLLEVRVQFLEKLMCISCLGCCMLTK